jgi:hypothetical protein
VSSDIEIANRPPMKRLEYLVFRRVLSGQWHHAHGFRWARKGSVASSVEPIARWAWPCRYDVSKMDAQEQIMYT